jgi:hypothetical protein
MLRPTNCRTGQFFLLPKVHKGMPGHPIVSGTGHPTEKKYLKSTSTCRKFAIISQGHHRLPKQNTFPWPLRSYSSGHHGCYIFIHKYSNTMKVSGPAEKFGIVERFIVPLNHFSSSLNMFSSWKMSCSMANSTYKLVAQQLALKWHRLIPTFW